MMEELSPEPLLEIAPPIHLFHVTGGLMLAYGANLSAWLVSASESPVLFCVPKDNSPLELLQSQAPLRVLGFSKFNHASQLQLELTDNFTLPIRTGDKQHWLADDQFHLWSGMGNALSVAGRDGEALLANRVSRQIHIALKRFERLSIAYRLAYRHAAPTMKPSAGDDVAFTSDVYAAHLGMEYRSCINELYSLRDAILASAYRLKFKKDDSYDMKRIKREVLGATNSPAAKITAQSMFDGSGDLLIDKMSLYRSVALHCLGATSPVAQDMYQLRYSNGPYGELPYLIYPLYDDVRRMREIERGASKAIFTDPGVEEAKRFMSLPKQLDALEFCFDCFTRLLTMAGAFAEEIDIAPHVTKLTDDQILELTFTQDGVTRRFKRNKDTGQLEECGTKA